MERKTEREMKRTGKWNRPLHPFRKTFYIKLLRTVSFDRNDHVTMLLQTFFYFPTCIKVASTWKQFISFKFRLQCSKCKLIRHMAYFLIHQSDEPGPFACWSLCFLILMPIIPIEISLILIVYSGASVIRTPTTRTLHLPDEFCWEPIFSMLFCTITPELETVILCYNKS